MSRKKLISYFFWISPFLSFLFGYFILHTFFQEKTLITPNIIGEDVRKGLKTLSEMGLSIRLLREQEDPDFSEGVILNQTPRPGYKIKPNQYIFVTVSKEPQKLILPDFYGQDYKSIRLQTKKVGLKSEIFWLNSIYPNNSCIAQSPQPNTKLSKNESIIYLSSGTQNLYIVPNFRDCSIDQLKKICEEKDIELDILYDDNKSDFESNNYIVFNQKPMAGSIIDLSKKLYIQVQVKSF